MMKWLLSLLKQQFTQNKDSSASVPEMVDPKPMPAKKEPQRRKINKEGLKLIKDWEGLRLKPYYCSANVLTIGYGSTGSHVKKGMVITEKEAEDLLQKDLERFEKAVEENVQVQITDNQFAALVSFSFNVGSAALKKSTLLKILNSGDKIAAADQFLRWNKAGGKVLTGLTKRRQAEKDLFLKGL